MKPVQVLYHGTTYKYSEQIESSGLMPINHDSVYLTADIVVAYEYAKNASKNNYLSLPVICIVDALQMYKDGYTFNHTSSNAEWTVDKVPSKYLLQLLIEYDQDISDIAEIATRLYAEIEDKL